MEDYYTAMARAGWCLVYDDCTAMSKTGWCSVDDYHTTLRRWYTIHTPGQSPATIVEKSIPRRRVVPKVGMSSPSCRVTIAMGPWTTRRDQHPHRFIYPSLCLVRSVPDGFRLARATTRNFLKVFLSLEKNRLRRCVLHPFFRPFRCNE